MTRGGRRVATIGPASACPGRAVKELLRRHRPDDAWAEVAHAHARLLAHVRRTGGPGGAHDLIIAATAAATGRTVVSADASGFEQLPDIAVLDRSG